MHYFFTAQFQPVEGASRVYRSSPKFPSLSRSSCCTPNLEDSFLLTVRLGGGDATRRGESADGAIAAGCRAALAATPAEDSARKQACGTEGVLVPMQGNRGPKQTHCCSELNRQRTCPMRCDAAVVVIPASAPPTWPLIVFMCTAFVCGRWRFVWCAGRAKT